jgi:ATP-dependent DNA helicase RecG
MAYGGLNPERPESWPEALDGKEFAERFPGESDTVEFKQGLTGIPDSVVAFSNTHGGIICAGVHNNGSAVGLPFTASVEDRIIDEVRHTNSPGSVVSRGIRVADKEITLIGVGRLREGFSQTSSGRVLVRLGTRRIALIGNDLVRFMHERATSSFESAPTDFPLEEADSGLVQEVAHQLGIARGAKMAERLQERGLVTTSHGLEVLTVAGALYLLQRPDQVLGKAYIEVMRFPEGSEDFDWRQEITGPLPNQVIEATHLVSSQLGVDSVVLGLRRHDLPRIPERVLRETIANAVAHRSYEQRGTAVRIELRRDHLDVISPGGLVPPVTVETMRDAFAARNNGVIRLLRRYDLAEDSGKGVDMIQDLMRDELLSEPTFIATDASVRVSLPVLSGTRPEERAWVREVVEQGRIEDRDRVLLIHARRGERLTNQRVRELLSTGREGAVAALRRLVAAGLLIRQGHRGGSYYQLAIGLAPPAGLTLTRDELRQLVLEMARNSSVTNQLVRERTGLDRQVVLGLFDDLVDAGELRRIGERRGTRYVLVDGS